MKIKVSWVAEYESIIEVESMEDVDDALYDVDIPESNESKYVDATYEVLKWEPVD